MSSKSSKKFWKTLLSKDAKHTTPRDHHSRDDSINSNSTASSKSSKSSMTSGTSRSKFPDSIPSRSTSTRPAATAMSNANKAKRHMSTMDLNFDSSQFASTADDKEREFYKSLGNVSVLGGKSRHKSLYIPNSTIAEGSDSDTDSDLDIIDLEKFKSTSHKTQPSQSSSIDPLSSALEDYKIFTKSTEKPARTTPTNLNFDIKPQAKKSIDSLRENSHLSSLPSFSSSTTVDSGISIKSVSNSLWIGTTVMTEGEEEEEEEEEEEGNVDHHNHYNPISTIREDFDAFKEFDSDQLFLNNDVPVKKATKNRVYRTSLIFL